MIALSADLTREEFEVMKLHVQLGYEMVKGLDLPYESLEVFPFPKGNIPQSHKAVFHQYMWHILRKVKKPFTKDSNRTFFYGLLGKAMTIMHLTPQGDKILR